MKLKFYFSALKKGGKKNKKSRNKLSVRKKIACFTKGMENKA